MRRIGAAQARPQRRSATAEQVLDLAETLIQTRSYSAFSYQDIADALGIRKASIHYHFATKAELGAAVVDRYVERFGSALAAMAKDQSKSSLAMLDFYCEPYLQFAQTSDRVCLCGALAAEALALPPEIRERVAAFFLDHQNWLAGILERGARRGEFKLPAPPARMARMTFGALQGALIVKRTTGDITQLRDVVLALKSQLDGSRGGKTAAVTRLRPARH
jgi:TetR/AcrR family transcriptional regulator, transcriptional repressor for nem operon